MTLTTHAIAGAATASFMPEHPVLGFVGGFASHLVLDAVPHWNYHTRSASINPRIGGAINYNKDLLIDAAAIAGDGLLGLLLSLLFFGSPSLWFVILCGAAGGEFPDALHFVYTRWPFEPLTSFTKFHIRIQTDIYENAVLRGILSQLITATLIVGAALWLHHLYR